MDIAMHIKVGRRRMVLTLMSIMFIASFIAPGLVVGQQKYLYDDLFGVSFPDANNGWACGRWGTILHTADGGSTWEKQKSTTTYTLSSICFADARNGWAVGDKGTILHTADAGKTWQKQNSPVPLFLMDVVFLTPSKGWIVTEQTTVLFTADGGATWDIQFQDQDFILKAVSFADEMNGWAVGEYGYIYHTASGGVTWEKQAGFFDISDVDGLIVAGTYLFDVDAVDAQTVWAAGIEGYIIKSEDSGKTWVEVKTGLPKTHLFSLLAQSKDAAIIGGDGVVAYTADGGRSWQQAQCEPPVVYSWLYRIEQVTGGTFVTVGREGDIYLGNLTTWNKAQY